MTRYTVVWDEQVESQFLRAWLRGDSNLRSILTGIANWVDEQLAVDPERKGLAVDEPDTRVLAVPISTSQAHVSVTFQILPEDRQVRVVRLLFRGG
jgi:hypothetical protein